MKYCDDCLTAAYDQLATGRSGFDPEDLDNQEQLLDTISALIILPDHTCARIETDGEIACACKAH